jgi:hypothetical protein
MGQADAQFGPHASVRGSQTGLDTGHSLDSVHAAHAPVTTSHLGFAAGHVMLDVHSTHRPLARSHTRPVGELLQSASTRQSMHTRRVLSQPTRSAGQRASSSSPPPHVAMHRWLVRSQTLPGEQSVFDAHSTHR